MKSSYIRAFAPLLIGGMYLFTPTSNLYVNAASVVQDNKPAEQKKPEISPEEFNALKKMENAKNTDALMKAAEEYAKKFEKGKNRNQVPGFVLSKITQVTDPTQKVTYIKKYLEIFKTPADAQKGNASLIEAYFDVGKPDDAINASNAALQGNPDNLDILISTVDAGTRYALKANTKPTGALADMLVKNSNKAVELIEADKKPAELSAEEWNTYRNTKLPVLYYVQGYTLFFSDKPTEARDALEKAAGINPYDPNTLALLSDITNKEYNELAQKYQTEKKSALLNQALGKLDETIDWMARFVAVTETNPQFKAGHDQMLETLKQYYAFRHDGKSDGLEEIIKKYKKP